VSSTLEPRHDHDDEPSALSLVRTLEDLGLLDDVSLRPAELPAGLTVAQTLAVGGLLGRFARSVPWWTGDLLVYAQSRWGEEVVGQLEAATGLSPETLADYQRMAELIPPAERIPGLSFRHHRAVKTLDSAKRRGWLELSVEQEWSSDRLRTEIAAERAQSEPERARPEPERGRAPASEALQLQIGPLTLREIADEIIRMPRDDHGRVSLDRNILERLRAALGRRRHESYEQVRAARL
jgi:hypothetical protein